MIIGTPLVMMAIMDEQIDREWNITIERANNSSFIIFQRIVKKI